jgi:hypothetical protein
MEKDENIMTDDLKKIKIGATNDIEDDGIEYWRKDITEFKQVSNIVLIHVCDENRCVKIYISFLSHSRCALIDK